MPHYDDKPIHFRLPIYGMIGYLENLYDAYHETSDIAHSPAFILMDSQSPEELCVFIQHPDCYREVMYYTTLSYFRRVNIFANCIDIRTMSTVFNLVKDLTYRHIDTYVYYPKRFNKDEIPDDYVRNRFKKMSNWRSQVYSDISVEYRISDPTDKEAYEKGDIPRDKLYYDIVIKIPKEVIYLPALVTYDKLNKWCKEGRKVLLPYCTKFYDNSITYADLSINHDWVPKYSKHVCIRSFPTWSAYVTAKNSDPNFNPAPMFPMTVLRRFTI